MSVLDKFKSKPKPEVKQEKPQTNAPLPTVKVELTPQGLKVYLENWRHDAPVGLLGALDVRVQQEIHRWRGEFLKKEAKFGTPNNRESETAVAQRSAA